MKKGYLITLEGGEGVGKTTQCQNISDYLKESGVAHLVTREPGGTPFGAVCRNLVLERSSVSDMARLMLFMADRAQHYDQVILPSLAAGTTVICDRSIDSTVAYQGYGQGMDIDFLNACNWKVTNKKPDLTILLDAPVEHVQDRLKGDYYEDKLELLRDAREGFVALMGSVKHQPSRWRYIDATQSLDDVSHDVRYVVNAFFGPHFK